MRRWKRAASLGLAGIMALSVSGITPMAAPETGGDGTGTGTVQTETVEIGSDVWETPVIPDASVSVAGVSETEISLNDTSGSGTWKFLFDIPDYTLEDGVPYPTEENQDFDFTAWKDKNWQNIIVPGEALMQGFDILTNNEYYYQREITIPEDFAGNRVLVRFDGVYSNARVWIDGKYIRTHVGGFTTWDCDITEYAAPGETVTMTVGVADIYSNTDGIWNPGGKVTLDNPSHATDYAHHNIGGILRDVSLVAMPYNYIARTYVETDFDEDFVNADLEVTAQLGMVSGDAKLQVELLDEGSLVASGELSFEREGGEAEELVELVSEATELLEKNADNLYENQETGEVGQYSKEAYENMEKERDEALALLAQASELTEAQKITIPVEAPKQWDAEHPNLYTLRTTLLVDGEEIQVNEERIGFREIHYNGKDGTDANKVYVNGKEVKLRGTCRHDVSDDLGRSMTREESYAEARAYKNANINFIRTSHYPASEHLLEACDELGIYVEQETAVCFQGYGTFGNSVYSKYEDYLPQFTEMIERDRNHASILIWSLGNESSYENINRDSGGNAIQDEKDYLLDVDTSRPCIFSWPGRGEPSDLSDIYSQHYASVTGGMGSSGKPILHDEYAHISCYNLDELQRDVNVRNFWGESVKKAWENIFTSDGALGGALWGGIDDVFYIPDGTSERWQTHSSGQTAGYGEWGSVLDAYLREKPEAYLTKKAYSPVRVDEESCYVSGGTLFVPVKNWFDHTDMNEVKLEVSVDGGAATELQIGESIAPHSEGVISVPGVEQSARKVNLKFYTADGVMVDEYNVELAQIDYSFTPASDEAPEISETDDSYVINGENFALAFSKTTGLISSGTYGEEEGALLTGGPYLHVTGMSLGAWTPDQEEGITVGTAGNYVVVTLKGTYENGQGVQFDIQISGNGIITTGYTLTTEPATATGLREVGISYDIPMNMESVSWKRDGLYSAYPEDHIGRNEGTALKEREGADENPDEYGVEPEWPWKDDMMNYFVYATDDPNNGLVTNDFKTMRENVYYYTVNYGSDENAPRISVEAPGADVAARVSVVFDKGYVDDRDSKVQYEGNWSAYGDSSDYEGTEMYSSGEGASCEFTFTGTGVRFIGSRQNNTGKVEIYIDDQYMETVDTYSDLGNHLKQSEIYRIDGLEEKEHTIRLVTCGGDAECIVVDAFEVLSSQGSASKEEAQLIVNNQWYYPNLAWGNYCGVQGTLALGSTGSATIRLTNGTNFTERVIASVSNVQVKESAEDLLEVSYDLQNAGEDAKVNIQWYQVAVGDPDSKAQAIDGETAVTLDVTERKANRVFCEITVESDGTVSQPVRSNTIEVGTGFYRYYDITADSAYFQFTGTAGTDYQTDAGQVWTANAYENTVTYLLDTPNEAGVEFKFYGAGIRWIGAREENQGIAEVRVDGGEAERVDLFESGRGSSNLVNEVLYECSWSEPGEHTITIFRTGDRNEEASASNISLDAFIVVNQKEEMSGIENLTISTDENGMLQASCEVVNGDASEVEYQWYSREAYSAEGYAKGEREPIPDAVGSSYQPAAEDSGKLICCRAAFGRDVVFSDEVLTGAEIIDGASENIQYSGSVITDPASGYLAGHKPYAETVTFFLDTATFRFNGTGIVWIAGYDKMDTFGIVKIDDGEETRVEIPGTGFDFNQYEVFRVENLEPGDHVITIATGEEYANLDAFMVLNPGSVQVADSAISEESAAGQPAVLQSLKNLPLMLAAPAQTEIDTAITELTQAIADFKASQIGKVAVTGISLSAETLELEAGKSAKLTVNVEPDDATDQSVAFSSSDETVAKVDADGNVEALKAGTAVITVKTTDGGFEATCTVTVKDNSGIPTPEPADKTLLQEAYDYALNLNTEGVAESAKEFFETALAEAKAALENPDITQEEVNAAWNKLTEGILGLGIVQGDKAALALLIERAEGMAAEADRYVAENWQQLLDALEAAKEVMNDSDALAEEIDPAADALHKAILAQRYKANKDNLEALIRQAEAIDLSAYTEESVAVFRTALEEAKALMADETLSEDDQGQVDQAVLTLQAAMNALEPVDPDKPGGEDTDDPGQTTPTPGGSDGGNSGNGQNTQTGNKPSGGSGTGGSTQKPGGAQTGDNRNMGLWALTLGAAAVLLTGAVVYKKKRG